MFPVIWADRPQMVQVHPTFPGAMVVSMAFELGAAVTLFSSPCFLDISSCVSGARIQ
ncbi:hypothetical protein LINPERPRIM_LOCUS2689 [Linum perenne]